MAEPILRQLILHRFRSLQMEQVEFDNPTFLVGQNGSGKSNFADAFAFLADAMVSPLRAVIEHRGGFSTVVHRGSQRLIPYRNLGLSVVLENLNGDMSHARYGFELRYRRDYGFEVMREQCIVQQYDGSIDWINRRTAKDSTMRWGSSMDFPVPFLEPYALALPLVGGDVRFQAVLRFLSEMRVYRIDPAALRTMQDPDGGVRLHSDGSNAASVLREIQHKSPYAWRQILEILESIVPGTVDVQLKRHGNKLTLEFTQDWAQTKSVTFEALNMSDGTLRTLGLLAAVFQCPAPSLLVIEEPEATIHPGALGSILDVLRHAGRFMQVVVTTHSPDVLDAKWIEERHLRIVNCDKGATRISRVSPATREALSEHLMGAGELLRSNALTPADLFDHNPSQLRLFEDDLS